MINLISARPAERITTYPSIVDVQEISGTSEGQATIQLWEDICGEPAGFTLLDGPVLAFEISPQVDFDDLASQMIDWAKGQLASTDWSGYESIGLETACREEDIGRIVFLERRGFVAQPVRTLHFVRSLDKSIPKPCLPDGFLIRPINGEGEAQEWVRLHRAAHRTATMTVDFRLAMMRTPDYKRDLDLVAVSPEDQLAAYVVCYISEEENRLREQKVGHTDPVATHPDFQGKGLARALLYAGFERLKACGMEFAEVSTWGENIAMIRTAESAGYSLYSTTICFKNMRS